MSRRSSIQTLLSESEQQFQEIKQLYLRSVELRRIDPVVGVRIKNYCENLRSVLDYLANEIRERCCDPGQGARVYYFPIFERRRAFERKMNQWFPGLDSRCADVYRYLISVQPFRHRRPPPYLRWLWHFNRLNNAGKHGDLVIHTTRHAPAGSSGRLGSVAIRDDSGRWTEVRFKLPRKNAILLLWEALEGVHEIEEDLGALLVDHGY